MKKLIIICMALMIFTACGAKNTEEIPEIIIENISENLEKAEILETQETDEPRIFYESGVLGIKLSIPDIPVWDFFVWGYANRDFPFLQHLGQLRGIPIMVSFSIGNFTVRPADWTPELFGDAALQMGHQTWAQTAELGEPDEVFVTDNGITVVKYSQIAPAWGDTGNNVETVLFVFREDGRDYREIEERSTFFAAVLHAHFGTTEAYYDYALEVINGLQFHEGAEIQNVPTEEANSIGITTKNFPIIDGSTSVMPLFGEILQAMFAPPVDDGTFETVRGYYPWRGSRTVPSYELLISGEVDMILVPDPSDFVLNLAEEAGVELQFTPVASEALVFITSANNPVSDIANEQVLQIYTDRTIANWAQLGGNDGRIIPLNRNPHSGSQTLMDNFILQGRELDPELIWYSIGGMDDMIGAAMRTQGYYENQTPDDFALGYTVYFFLSRYYSNQQVKILSFDGVSPTRETILSGEYPLSTNYFAVIRADTPQEHSARKIINWLLTPSGQTAVETAGLGRID